MYQMDSGSPVLTGSVMHCWPAKKAVGMSTAGHLTTFGRPNELEGGQLGGGGLKQKEIPTFQHTQNY